MIRHNLPGAKSVTFLILLIRRIFIMEVIITPQHVYLKPAEYIHSSFTELCHLKRTMSMSSFRKMKLQIVIATLKSI